MKLITKTHSGKAEQQQVASQFASDESQAATLSEARHVIPRPTRNPAV